MEASLFAAWAVIWMLLIGGCAFIGIIYELDPAIMKWFFPLSSVISGFLVYFIFSGTP